MADADDEQEEDDGGETEQGEGGPARKRFDREGPGQLKLGPSGATLPGLARAWSCWSRVYYFANLLFIPRLRFESLPPTPGPLTVYVLSHRLNLITPSTSPPAAVYRLPPTTNQPKASRSSRLQQQHLNMAPKRIRCTASQCREPAQRIVGDCTFCQGHFCGKHRLLEDHKCTGLEDVSTTPKTPPKHHAPLSAPPAGSLHSFADPDFSPFVQCKKQSHERNAAQLESERTQVIRGV
ncbi:hypothetical protein AK830_g9496 [Neonectria ditissima]|uniref:AN1-type domain-containing protein n=1 Tax=Neonectria ditissima TaxID=78410 RepID=A0A0N8H5T5_9HYPO|nr:hypothetical protein AK830_g9496 [Neonectria ditissima]